jgi:hypothetical protein
MIASVIQLADATPEGRSATSPGILTPIAYRLGSLSQGGDRLMSGAALIEHSWGKASLSRPGLLPLPNIDCSKLGLLSSLGREEGLLATFEPLLPPVRC